MTTEKQQTGIHENNEAPSDLRSFYHLLDKKSHPDGKQFNYVSPNSDLLGWIIERSTGERFSDILSDLFWKPLGATMPSYITVDRLGAPRVAGGLCTTAIDLALVGQLFLDYGFTNDQQILPKNWLQDIQENAAGKLGLKGILPNISLTGIYITDLNGMWIMGPMTQKQSWYLG